jgi:hypothetical protein
MVDKKKMTRGVSIKLSDAQCLEVGQEQAKVDLEIQKLEAEAKSKAEAAKTTAKDYKDRIDKLWERSMELARQQETKARTEQVEVVEEFDLDRKKVLYRRADAPQQILEQRDMTMNEIAAERQRIADERQEKLDFDAEQKAVEAKSNGDGQKVVKLDRSRKRASKDAKTAAAEPDEGDTEEAETAEETE